MDLPPAHGEQAGEERHRLSHQSHRQEIEKIADGMQRPDIEERDADQRCQADDAAEPRIRRGAQELAPRHLPRAQRGQALRIPGTVADFADHGLRGVARTPDDDDGVEGIFRRDVQPVPPLGEREGEEDEPQHSRHQNDAARR